MSLPPKPFSFASSFVINPSGVETTNIPKPTPGRYLLSHSFHSLLFTAKRGLTAEHWLTLPRSFILKYPFFPSSTNSKSPMKPLRCSILRVSRTSLEGFTSHAGLQNISCVLMALSASANGSFAIIIPQDRQYFLKPISSATSRKHLLHIFIPYERMS